MNYQKFSELYELLKIFRAPPNLNLHLVMGLMDLLQHIGFTRQKAEISVQNC